MNERGGSSFGAKRKTGLQIAGDRINPHHYHRPQNPYFGIERNHHVYPVGSPHLQRPRCRGFNGQAGFRSASFKGNLNRYTPQPRDVPSFPSKDFPSKRAPISTRSVSQNCPGNDKPATFVCEGIEVNFDSSDSEEEVRPWKIVKVLKKNVKSESTLQISSVEDEVKRQKVMPPVQRKTLCKQNMPDDDRSDDEVQVLSPPSDPVSENQKRPSFVVLSGLRKRPVPSSSGPINNCAIIKRPRFLLSQQVRPSMRPAPDPRYPFPPLQEVSLPCIGDKNADLTLEELRIIEDVLDMTEEVESRARYLNYR